MGPCGGIGRRGYQIGEGREDEQEGLGVGRRRRSRSREGVVGYGIEGLVE
jgi:hypothetical protein